MDFERAYQQASHTVVLFLPTAGAADNRTYANRSEADVRPSPPVNDPDLAPAWQQQAECLHHAGHVDFFPARGESVRDAKAVCTICPVKSECLEYALQHRIEQGVWGGASERERRRILRQRRRAGAVPS